MAGVVQPEASAGWVRDSLARKVAWEVVKKSL